MGRPTKAETLRRRIAELENELREVRAELAEVEHPEDASAAPTSPVEALVDALWAVALKNTKLRTTREKCRKAIKRIPLRERPSIEQAVAALIAWNRCEQWVKQDHQFAKGLHVWLADRAYEDPPEDKRRSAAPAPRAADPKPGDAPAGDVAAVADFLKISLFDKAP